MSEFTDFLHEVLRDFGEVSSRRMFGGHGLYHNGLMFGLIADDVLYLKTDDVNRAHFEAQGLSPFQYEKQGRTMSLSYWRAPDAIYDDPALAAHWAGLAFEAALRKQQMSKPVGRLRASKPAKKPSSKRRVSH